MLSTGLMLPQMNKKTQNLQPDTISTIFVQSEQQQPQSAQYSHGPCSPADSPSFEVATLSGVLVLKADHIIIL
jgi:hypothetical protein